MVTTYDVPSAPDEMAANLANPRNLVTANRPGRVVDQSDPPTRTGSWAVLAYDQLRVRIDYTAFEPPVLVAVAMTYTGRGSRGMSGTFVYQLAPMAGSWGTRVTIDTETSGGWVPDAVSRLMLRLTLRRRMRRDPDRRGP